MDYPTDFNKKRPGPWDDETFELTEDVFTRWDEEDAKWYNKYFVRPLQRFIQTIKDILEEQTK